MELKNQKLRDDFSYHFYIGFMVLSFYQKIYWYIIHLSLIFLIYKLNLHTHFLVLKFSCDCETETFFILFFIYIYFELEKLFFQTVSKTFSQLQPHFS